MTSQGKKSREQRDICSKLHENHIFINIFSACTVAQLYNLQYLLVTPV